MATAVLVGRVAAVERGVEMGGEQGSVVEEDAVVEQALEVDAVVAAPKVVMVAAWVASVVEGAVATTAELAVILVVVAMVR